MTSLTRRGFLFGTTAALTGCARRGTDPSAPRAPTRTVPNVVFILADDLGYADVSCYGRRDYVTRNIDRLASQGIRLLRAYANSPVCSASRTAIITGRYQYRLPLGLEEPLADRSADVGIPASHPTLPSILKRLGYETSLVGKWHLGRLPTYGPLQCGYDHFFGSRGGAIDYFTHKSGNAKSGDDDLWDGDVQVHEHGYLTDLLGDRAVSRIELAARTGRPFLLSLHFSAPHWPWEGPDDEVASTRVGQLNAFDSGTLATYARMVVRMDFQVGRVLDALERGGLARDTIVIFTSDNGGERFSDTWPFSGKKTELLEGGLRVPAIVRWPGHVAPGATTEQAAIGMDWLPTLLAAAGAAPDAAYPSDGIDLLPFLTDPTRSVPRRLFWRYKLNDQEAALDGAFKYLKIRGNTFLFNVVEDPLERANLKERHKDVLSRLAADYAAWSRTMLPLDPASYTYGFTGADLADHYGVERLPPAPPLDKP